jgi:glyoxylase-like metal-dependent hydrolase (beta-lactamase superfamily II)
MSLDIKYYMKGMYYEITYLITDEATGLQAVIDPGYFGNDVRKDIPDGNKLKYMLLTHGHHDHFLAAQEYLNEYGDLTFAVPHNDAELIKSEPYACPEPTLLLKEGDVITLGETKLRVIETPGHTGGGICFLTDRELFSGDTLFKLSVGRTDLPTGDWDTLLNSITQKLYTLDDDLVVFPGHGLPTTIGYEKRANPFV